MALVGILFYVFISFFLEFAPLFSLLQMANFYTF